MAERDPEGANIDRGRRLDAVNLRVKSLAHLVVQPVSQIVSQAAKRLRAYLQVPNLNHLASAKRLLRSRTAKDAPISFPKVSDGDCLLQALTARAISYWYLSADEITEAMRARGPVVAFRLNNVLYYHGNRAGLRRSDRRGARVPGPLINNAKIVRLVKQKDRTKKWLRSQGFNVPKGAVFSCEALSEAETFFAAFAPSLSGGVCVKPANGSLARRVTVGIRDLSSFRAAFLRVSARHKRVVVEETVAGKVHRFFCLAGRVIAIHSACVPCVRGDGTHTIAELVQFRNVQRRLSNNPYYAQHPLRLGPRERLFLKQGGFEPAHIPEVGEIIFLSRRSDLGCGGEKIDATDAVDRSYIDVVERIVGSLPGLIICGPDVIIADASVPATSENYHILELNGRAPGFVDHHYPYSGQSRDVTGPLIDYLSAAG